MICFIFLSRFWPTFWWRDSSIYLVLSTFICRPNSLLASKHICTLTGWPRCLTSTLIRKSLNVPSLYKHKPVQGIFVTINRLVSYTRAVRGTQSSLLVPQHKPITETIRRIKTHSHLFQQTIKLQYVCGVHNRLHELNTDLTWKIYDSNRNRYSYAGPIVR
jgi:hypothetical protein